jgi:hypothetical protein
MELLANRDDINAVEIVDLTAEGPTASLRRHVGVVPDLRVLVCGGDGTVAWVLQAMEELGEVRRERRGVPNLGPKTAFPTHFFFRSVSPTLTKKTSSFHPTHTPFRHLPRPSKRLKKDLPKTPDRHSPVRHGQRPRARVRVGQPLRRPTFRPPRVGAGES